MKRKQLSAFLLALIMSLEVVAYAANENSARLIPKEHESITEQTEKGENPVQEARFMEEKRQKEELHRMKLERQEEELRIKEADASAYSGKVRPLAVGEKTYKPYPGASYDLTYTENTDGTVTITGYTGNAEGELLLPSSINGSSVTSIGYRAFNNCSGFTGSLTIPDSVTSIGDWAFSWCKGFTGGLMIPDGVTSIGRLAFSDCWGFTGGLTIGSSVTSIGDGAFSWCSGFTGSLTIGNSVTTIGDSAFYLCSGFTGGLTIPDSVTSIGDGAFGGCSGTEIIVDSRNLYYNSWDGILFTEDMTKIIGCPIGRTGSLTIPDSVTSIGNWAFSGCSGFTGSLTIPDGVTSIGDGAFVSCSGFTGSLTIPASVTSIGDSAFDSCSGFTGSLTIPDSVTSIGWGAFADCNGFTGSLTIGSSVTSIGDRAFYCCDGFTGSLTIPTSVTSIGHSAFEDCSGFTGSLTIPDSVTSIGDGAFAGCGGAEIIVNPQNFYYNSWDGILFTKDMAKIIGCPIGKTGSLTISDGVTSIGDRAFYCCDGFTGSLTIPDSVTSIGDRAFYGCSGFTGSLMIPDGVTGIGDRAFYCCYGFTGSLTIPASVTSIGESAFDSCSGFTGGLTIGSSVTSIGDAAFRYCSGIKAFSVAEENPVYSSDKWGVLFNKDKTELFYYPSARIWPYYNVPDSVTAIGDRAFYQAQNLSNLYVPSTVTDFGHMSIYDCPGLTLCIYRDSAADRYALDYNIPVWYMDNCELQGIRIHSLPEKRQPMGQKELPGLYMVQNIGGRELQLDDYTLTFSSDIPGPAVATVSYGDFSESFSVEIFDPVEEYVLDVNGMEYTEGHSVFVAAYDKDDRMIGIRQAAVKNGVFVPTVSSDDWWRMDHARVFRMDGNLLPVDQWDPVRRQP